MVQMPYEPTRKDLHTLIVQIKLQRQSLAERYGMQPKKSLYACHPPLGKLSLQDLCTGDLFARWATVMSSLVTALKSSGYPRDGNLTCDLI